MIKKFKIFWKVAPVREMALPAKSDHAERHPVCESVDVTKRRRHEAQVVRHHKRFPANAVQVLKPEVTSLN